MEELGDTDKWRRRPLHAQAEAVAGTMEKQILTLTL